MTEGHSFAFENRKWNLSIVTSLIMDGCWFRIFIIKLKFRYVIHLIMLTLMKIIH